MNKIKNFCYIFGKVNFASQKCNITAMITKDKHIHFRWTLGDSKTTSPPHICCCTCARNLCKCLNRKRYSMSFAVAITWKELRDQREITGWHNEFTFMFRLIIKATSMNETLWSRIQFQFISSLLIGESMNCLSDWEGMHRL